METTFIDNNSLKDNNPQTSEKIILITGGAGFIGSNLIHYFLQKYPHYKIINFDKLTYAGNLYNLSRIETNQNYYFLKGDVAKQSDVRSVFEEFSPGFVVNCAAESHVDRGIVNPDVFLQSNVIGTQILLDAARDFEVKKFLQISTDEVYGCTSQYQPASEESCLLPNNLYAASKAAADLLVRVAHQTFGQNVNIIRSCNNYGPCQFPEKLIPLMISKAMRNENLPLYGDGRQKREWIHVTDNCRAIDLVLLEGRSGEIYNAGTGLEKVNLELVEYIRTKFPESQSRLIFVADRPGHDFCYGLDSNKIRTELGWEPSVQFEDGINQTIDWYRQNTDWLQNIRSGNYQNYYRKNYYIDSTEMD